MEPMESIISKRFKESAEVKSRFLKENLMSDRIMDQPFVQGLAYDDVLLIPQHSEVLPNETDLSTVFSRNITLKSPLLSAAMDTVTEAETAIVMAQNGGLGIIHKNILCVF